MGQPRLSEAQAAVYAAEDETLANRGRQWLSVRDAQAYLDGLVASAWFFEQWPGLVRATIERRGRGATWSTCHALDTDGEGGAPTEGVILLAGKVLSQATLLHELAHLVAPPAAGHGPAFVGVLLELVRHEMGFDAFAELSRALR